MSRQQVRVHIFHQNYTLLTDEDPKEVERVAQEIDELMATIANRLGTGDATRVAVLACMHLADKLRQAQNKLGAFESKSEAIAGLLAATLAEG